MPRKKDVDASSYLVDSVSTLLNSNTIMAGYDSDPEQNVQRSVRKTDRETAGSFQDDVSPSTASAILVGNKEALTGTVIHVPLVFDSARMLASEKTAGLKYPSWPLWVQVVDAL